MNTKLIFASLRQYAVPVMWVLTMLSTLMLLSFYDAETFLISFLLAVMGFLGVVWFLPNRAQLSMPRSPFIFLMLAFWGVAFASVVFSASAFTSYLFFCFLGMLPLSFIHVSLASDKVRMLPVVYGASIFICLGLSLICFAQYFLLPEFLPHGLTQYPFGNPNSLAGYLSLGFFCSYGVFVNSKTIRRRALSFALSFIILSAIFTTGSRGATLALIIGMGVFTFLLRGVLKPVFKWHVGFACLALLAFFGLSFVAPDINGQTPIDVLQRSLSGQTPLLWDRPYIWASTWEIAKDNFWSGIGVGTFFQVYPSYRGDDFSTAGHMAHNDLLQFWAEMGVFSPLLFCALLLYAVFKTSKVLKKLPLDDVRRIWIVVPFCGAGALVLHTQISFHFYVLPTLFLLGGVLALWFSKVEDVSPSKVWHITSGSFTENMLVKMCVSALIICSAGMLVLSQVSEVLVDRAKVHARADNIQGFVDGINKANELSFGRNARALALASTVSSGIVRENGAKMKPAEVFKFLLRAERQLDQALTNQPYMASAYHEKALLVELALKYVPQQYRAHHGGSPPDVRALMEKAVHYDPLHANTRVKLAEVMIDRGDADEAYLLLKDGMKWRYLGTKGMRLYQAVASMALERGDTQTHAAALDAIQRIYKQANVVQARDAILKRKLGALYGLLK